MKKIKIIKILGIIGSAIILISLFLPCIKLTFSIFGNSSSFSISIFQYWEGKFVLFFLIVVLLFMFKNLIEKYVPQIFNNGVGKMVRDAKNSKLVLIPIILIAVLALSMLIRTKTIIENTYPTYLDSENFKYCMSIGYWILWVGIGTLVAYTFLYKDNIEPQINQSVAGMQPYTQSNSEPSIKYCPYCRAKCDTDASTCPGCGYQF